VSAPAKSDAHSGSTTPEDARAVALAAELGAQLARLKGAGPKVAQFLSMIQLAPVADGAAPAMPGALPDGVRPAPFADVRRVIEHDLDARIGKLFADVDEKPLALASLGQVHRARTRDGADVAVKVQHAGAAEAVANGLRGIGIVAPVVRRLAPGLDAGAVLAELRERVSDELDYETEAQNQRRLERRFRGHPHVRVARVHTDLSARRVLVTDYLDGIAGPDIARLGAPERDRAGEIAFRFYLGLAWREGTVAGDPHLDNCVLCPDGRLGLLDFALLRDLDGDDVSGESAVMRALAEGDVRGVHQGLVRLGCLVGRDAPAPEALAEHLGAAGEWLLAPGFRRVDPAYVGRILERGYPPRSPYFGVMRRLSVPPETLLLRRTEVQVLGLLGALNAGGDWAAIAAEHHSAAPPSTALGREDRAFVERRP
jgi:predicted unusual protein kinase regulating ubiquinone biosynthesis (AarF/ABC1/UbiB family)